MELSRRWLYLYFRKQGPAVLEYTVNVNLDDIPRVLSLITLEIPNGFADFPIAALPGDWRQSPSPASTKDFGSRKLKNLTHPVLRFPSTVIPEESNFIINPLHPIGARIEILDIADFACDIRIKKI